MQFEIAHFAETLRDIQSSDEYWNICHQALEYYGVKSLCYGTIPFKKEAKAVGITQSGFFKSTHSREWLDAVSVELNGSLENDLSVEAIVERSETTLWHDDTQWKDATPGQIAQSDLEDDLGMRVGISFAISDPTNDICSSGIGLSTPDISEREFERYWREHNSQLTQISCLLEHGLRKQHGNILVGLSGREKDCLSYLAIGFRPEEIAFRLRISPKTLETYIFNAKRKLKARTRDNAVAKALILGVIQP
jgi:DNA-binding CsgD family transcriptional regulator